MTLSFQYEARRAVLAALDPDGGPETYDLCGEHADRTQPPNGWTMDDARPEDPDAPTPDATDLSSPRTIAVLAEALRGSPVGESPGGDEVADHDHAPVGDPPAPNVDTRALDAIVEEPLDDPASLDLFATPDDTSSGDVASDEVDHVGDAPASQGALEELSALSDGDAVADSLPPARTVPGARRPD